MQIKATSDNIYRIEQVAHFSPAQLAEYLQAKLSQQAVAYLTGINSPKLVGSWIRKGITPGHNSQMRLRYAYQAVDPIIRAYGKDTAMAWLFGSNTFLDDEAPAYILRYAESPEELTPVIKAAKSFVQETGILHDTEESLLQDHVAAPLGACI